MDTEIIHFYKGEFAIKQDWELTCNALGLPLDSESCAIEFVRAGIDENSLKPVSEINDSTKQLKTSAQWAKDKNIVVLDPDGWRTNTIFEYKFKPCNFDTTKISEFEFDTRCIISTCLYNPRRDDEQ